MERGHVFDVHPLTVNHQLSVILARAWPVLDTTLFVPWPGLVVPGQQNIWIISLVRKLCSHA